MKNIIIYYGKMPFHHIAERISQFDTGSRWWAEHGYYETTTTTDILDDAFPQWRRMEYTLDGWRNGVNLGLHDDFKYATVKAQKIINGEI